MEDKVTLKMTLPKIPDIELVALEGLERLAKQLGIDPEKSGEAKILVTEAIINAFEHAGGKNQAVRVEFTMTQTDLVVYVRDYGEGFDPRTIQTPSLESRMGSPNKRGWGLHLMKTLSDDFQIQSGKRGTKITLKKRLV